METERLDSDGNSSSDSGDTVDSSASKVSSAIETDIFSDDTPLACGLEDVDICESCQ